MTMLQHQATLHRECQPGGRLRSVKWFISSLTTVDFLLAAMIVSSDLYHTARTERQNRSPAGDSYHWSNDRRDEMLDAIDTAVGMWEGLKDNSMEAYKAHATLSVMLTQLKQHQVLRQAQQSFSSASGSAFAAPSPMDESNVAPEHSAAMTLGMLSTGGLTPNTTNMFDSRYPASMANLLNDPAPQPPSNFQAEFKYSGTIANGPENVPSPFSSLFGASLGFQNMDLPSTSNIDWDAWDSYIQGPGMDATNSFFPMDLGMQTDGTLAQNVQQNNANVFASNGGMNNGGPFMGVPEQNTNV